MSLYFVLTNFGRQITKYDICSQFGQANTEALSISAFRKTGIWPLNREVACDEKLAPTRITTNVCINESDSKKIKPHVHLGEFSVFLEAVVGCLGEFSVISVVVVWLSG